MMMWQARFIIQGLKVLVQTVHKGDEFDLPKQRSISAADARANKGQVPNGPVLPLSARTSCSTLGELRGLEPLTPTLPSVATTSAGLLLWRRQPSDRGGVPVVEVLLGHPGGPLFARKDDGHWSVPKGEYVAGDEDPLAAARREFAEELGVEAPTGEPVPLGEARQSGGKINTVWAVEGDLDVNLLRSNNFAMEWPPRSGRQQEFPELDRAAWFDLATARRKVFASQLPFLDRLAEHLAAAPR